MTNMGQRLSALRALMRAAGYDALIISREDEYLGEYIPAHNERLKWACGFNGSAGMLVVLPEKAAIFVDGRYTVQVRQEVDENLFECFRVSMDIRYHRHSHDINPIIFMIFYQ